MLPDVVCFGASTALTNYDESVYAKVYGPARVTGLNATSSGNGVRLSWEAGHVHVEKAFEVEVKVHYLPPVDADGWMRVGTGAANAESMEIARPVDEPLSYGVIKKAATTSAAGSYGTYRVVSVTDAFGTAAPAASSISAEVNHVQPRLPVVTYINVCVEWGWYLSWHNTILDEVRSVRVRGYATAAAASAVLEASAALIGSGGFGMHTAFPILAQRVYCSAYVSVPVGGSARGTSETTSSVSADTSAEPVSDSSALTPVQRVDAALTTLTTCLRDITTPAEKNTCVSAYADALDAIEEGDGAQ